MVVSQGFGQANLAIEVTYFLENMVIYIDNVEKFHFVENMNIRQGRR